MSIKGNVQLSGPVFDGRADLALKQACEESARGIAILGAAMVRIELKQVLRKESTPPVYRNRVESRADHPGWKIWDQDMIYGPWLEGTSERNRTTRFKGYATFRRMTQAIQARAIVICERVIATYSGRWK